MPLAQRTDRARNDGEHENDDDQKSCPHRGSHELLGERNSSVQRSNVRTASNLRAYPSREYREEYRVCGLVLSTYTSSFVALSLSLSFWPVSQRNALVDQHARRR